MKRQKPKPAAFMSYASSDDKYGHVTRFCEHLSHEVGACIGEDFLIFQDRKNILWGQNGEARIKESLDEVTFLIPIITPRFFNSSACRRELQRFLEREEKLKRDDLILPVYFINCPLLNDEEKRAENELAQVIDARQRADWRELRFKPFNSQEVLEALAELAVQIHKALERVQTPLKPVVSESAGGTPVLLPQDIGSATESREPARGPASKIKTPIHVVDQMGRGDHTTITEAIEAANPGDRILVRPGLYQEGLVIDKPGLEIIGDGNLDDVVVQAADIHTLLFETTMGKVANLTLRQSGFWFGVDVAQGRLELDECDITSQGLACVGIHDGADPRLRRNRIHGGKRSGIFVYKNGQGVLEDNDIFGNAEAGVVIGEGCNSTLRRNRINENGWAVWVYDGGGGTIEDNDLSDNARGAWDISDDSEPNLRRARNKE
jgi:F-box protein 11